MDADRKSTVSSFYGGPKNILNDNFDSSQTRAAPPTPYAASSFFDPDRGNDQVREYGSAGYDPASYYTGRKMPLKDDFDDENTDVFNVGADFNNVGERYSVAYGVVDNAAAPPPLKRQSVAPSPLPEGKEIVNVPGLGAEWNRTELREMSKTAKRKDNAAACWETWKRWSRDQHGLCGGWLTRRMFVCVLFATCVGIGIVLAFTLPRVPSYEFNSATPLLNATGAFAASIPVVFSRFPANFTFPAFADLQLNTQSNFLPLTFVRLDAQVFDLDTNRQVAKGELGKKTVPAKAFPTIRLPLNFTYVTSNDTDQTWKNWYDACKNRALYVDNQRPPLRFILRLQAVILGLPGSYPASAQVTEAPCPIQLPINSV